MEQIMNYVDPELLAVSAVLYFIGMGLKKAEFLPDKYIPVALGGIGVILCLVWVLAKNPFSSMQDVAMGIFTAVVQGILVAGLSTYINQIIKQAQREE